jgi:hypothetical protein
MAQRLTFDIMLQDRYYHTMRIALQPQPQFVEGYEGGVPVLNGKKLRRHIEKRLPSLKNRDYQILF